jgi:hypothetical protein
MIGARVEPDLKGRAEAMLEELGLSSTTAITLFYCQVTARDPERIREPEIEIPHGRGAASGAPRNEEHGPDVRQVTLSDP